MDTVSYDELKKDAIEGDDHALAVVLDWLEEEGVLLYQRRIQHAEILLSRGGLRFCERTNDPQDAVESLAAQLVMDRWALRPLHLPSFIEWRLGLTAVRAMAAPLVHQQLYARDVDGQRVAVQLRVVWSAGHIGHADSVTNMSLNFTNWGLGEATTTWSMRRSGLHIGRAVGAGPRFERIDVSVTALAAPAPVPALPAFFHPKLVAMPSGRGAAVRP